MHDHNMEKRHFRSPKHGYHEYGYHTGHEQQERVSLFVQSLLCLCTLQTHTQNRGFCARHAPEHGHHEHIGRGEQELVGHGEVEVVLVRAARGVAVQLKVELDQPVHPVAAAVALAVHAEMRQRRPRRIQHRRVPVQDLRMHDKLACYAKFTSGD